MNAILAVDLESMTFSILFAAIFGDVDVFVHASWTCFLQEASILADLVASMSGVIAISYNEMARLVLSVVCASSGDGGENVER